LSSPLSLPAPASTHLSPETATDGLYDSLSNESIVALIGFALNHPSHSGTIPRATVLSHLLSSDSDSLGVDGKAGKDLKKDADREGTFVFGKDTNYSTLLVRNSLAGGDEKKMRELLSVEPPISRYQRDDTTAKVRDEPLSLSPIHSPLRVSFSDRAFGPFRLTRFPFLYRSSSSARPRKSWSRSRPTTRGRSCGSGCGRGRSSDLDGLFLFVLRW
jgi:hypothetical protein